MKNTFGNYLTVTIFGESHGTYIGAVIDGISPGLDVDKEYIKRLLCLRRPSGNISTSRVEKDDFTIVSGVYENKTTGTPVCILIPNEDKRSKDYSSSRWLMRPSHADYTANCKYHGFEDYRGGGHFSGRVTAAIVAAGGIVIPALNKKGIKIGTHIKKCGGVFDKDFSEDLENDIEKLSNKEFAVLDDIAEEQMKNAINSARNAGDSVGGVLETAIKGLDAGLGEPFFDSVESSISHALFSVPAVKGVEFGSGFSLADMKGSEANDLFFFDENGNVRTKTNNSGGVNGGITNGMPVIFRTAFRPTPTISISQNTVDLLKKTNEVLSARGRHDPCIVHRARVVVDCITALVVSDILTGRYGTDWLAK